nr:type II toxin-antitoxin system RelE/ParE family toxin [Cytophagales bacterium]
GVEFLIKFDETVAQIRQNPAAYQAEYLHFRRAFMERFPYKIYYAVEDARQQIQVLAVFHQKQNPNLIQKRLGT